MARRKKKPTPGPKQAPPQRFHAPFAGLKKRLPLSPPPSDPPPPPEPEFQTLPENEDDLFAQAMTGVTPLNDRDRGPVPPRPGFDGPPIRINPQLQEDLEVLAQLADMVHGSAPLDIRFSDEYAEGFAPGLNPELAERLRQGAFPVQDYIDLHGLGRDEARVAVDEFVRGSRVKGYRSVLIVHGRGLGSRDQVPVLKKVVVDALSRKRFRSQVLGFCTARPVDGGAGALYVLLTRWRG
jgi:DNA-nicking Smr family endonuclease